jgi:hypothetical protein
MYLKSFVSIFLLFRFAMSDSDITANCTFQWYATKYRDRIDDSNDGVYTFSYIVGFSCFIIDQVIEPTVRSIKFEGKRENNQEPDSFIIIDSTVPILTPIIVAETFKAFKS